MLDTDESWVAEGTVRIPLLGDVAAGRPLEVFSVEENLDVPESLWNGRRVFALRARGQSMIDAGIRDGDYLIVEPCEVADNGRTVVAEIDGRVTVKKIYRADNGQIRFQPSNSNMLPLIVSGDRVQIRGVVVGVLRKYGFSTTAGVVRNRTPRSTPARPRPRRRRDDATLDLTVSVFDAQLARCKMFVENDGAKRDARLQARMIGLGRDLQALRDWCVRTSKPELRGALMADARRLIQEMHRCLKSRGLVPPETTPYQPTAGL